MKISVGAVVVRLVTFSIGGKYAQSAEHISANRAAVMTWQARDISAFHALKKMI